MNASIDLTIEELRQGVAPEKLDWLCKRIDWKALRDLVDTGIANVQAADHNNTTTQRRLEVARKNA